MSVRSPGPQEKRFRRALLRAAGALAIAVLGFSSQSAEAFTRSATIATASDARAATASSGTVLGGFTSQGWPVVVVFSKNEKRIAVVETGLEMTCASGENFAQLDGWAHLAIRANGGTHIAIAIPPKPGTSASVTGGSDSFTATVNRSRSKILGEWDLRLDFSLANGQTDQCDSGPVTFAAKL